MAGSIVVAFRMESSDAFMHMSRVSPKTPMDTSQGSLMSRSVLAVELTTKRVMKIPHHSP
jgi:hypothetical protein